ncbi:MAG: hypothetical protein WC220_09165 [Pedobacter sp.]
MSNPIAIGLSKWGCNLSICRCGNGLMRAVILNEVKDLLRGIVEIIIEVVGVNSEKIPPVSG